MSGSGRRALGQHDGDVLKALKSLLSAVERQRAFKTRLVALEYGPDVLRPQNGRNRHARYAF